MFHPDDILTINKCINNTVGLFKVFRRKGSDACYNFIYYICKIIFRTSPQENISLLISQMGKLTLGG